MKFKITIAVMLISLKYAMTVFSHSLIFKHENAYAENTNM